MSDNYNFHKNCAFYSECVEKDDTVDGHKIKRLWCPKISESKHQKNDKVKGIVFNCGDAYDRVGGQAYYPSDLHSVKYPCAFFEEYQSTLQFN